MEQNFKKQTSGHHSYSMRCVLGTSGKVSCVVCLAEKASPLDEANIIELTERMLQEKIPLKAYYYIAKSLSHYGNVDHLAPAGAMEEFVDYVHGLEQEEAKAFFKSLTERIKGHTEIHVLRGEHEWQKTLQRLKENFAQIHLLAPQDI